MSDKIVSVGTYKVAYTKKGSNFLYSKMFTNINDAVNYGHARDGYWLLMICKSAGISDYSWELLPYGNHKAYSIGSMIYKYRYVLLLIVVIALIYKFKIAGKAAAPAIEMGTAMGSMPVAAV